MRRRCSHRSFLWFAVLLGTGSLPLLFHLEDLSSSIQLLNPGVKKLQRNSEEEDVLDSPAEGDVSSLMFNGSRPPDLGLFQDSTLVPPVGSEKVLEQQRTTQRLRRRLLADICSKYWPGAWDQLVSKSHMVMVWAEDRSRLLYCEVPKAGCSNWKRVLMVLAGYADSALDIPHDIAHIHNRLPHLVNFDLDSIMERVNTYTKVLFVRDPFERLVSAFRDKFENPNDYYHRLFGRHIISRYRANASQSALNTGDGVTFREFVHYLLDPRRPVGMDSHWTPVSTLCHPCLIHYDFIGKFENMNSEANFLLRSIGAPPHVTFPDYKDRNPQDERTSSSIMRRYFSLLNATERQRVYDFYRMDYLMFSYSKPLPHLH
ncbi:carbohydrate sulfotransferase 8-like [Xyrichtys novacula]|uniref:Carbohydrate sulfotransferase n=1 Tax=Xyrichtys novacula TaxID=13765 RepID=A0AAV1F409_XYRNO|nr:carbohydrate sulfotransferase 8-like [Xyrichtys novacula]